MKTILTDKTYDILKWVALVLLPALGTLYFGLAGIWGFPLWRADRRYYHGYRYIPGCYLGNQYSPV